MRFSGLEGIREVFRFYYKLLKQRIVVSLTIIMLGLAYRVLNIFIFMLILKFCLVVIVPESILPVLNSIFHDWFPIATLDTETVTINLMVFLSIVVVLHYMIGKLNVSMQISLISVLQQKVINELVVEDICQKRNFCLDQIPYGVGDCVRLLEIFIAVGLILVFLLWLQPALGVLITIAIPFYVWIVLVKNKDQAKQQEAIRQYRERLNELEDHEFSQALNLNLDFIIRPQQNQVITNALSGGVMIFILVSLYIYVVITKSTTDQQVTAFLAFLIALCARFSIMYLKEFSIILGRLVRQRNTVPREFNFIS